MGYIKLSKPPNILIIYKEQNLVKTILLVLRERLELSRLTALAFETSVATNFTIRAYYLVGRVGFEPTHPEETDLQSAAALQLYRLPI